MECQSSYERGDPCRASRRGKGTCLFSGAVCEMCAQAPRTEGGARWTLIVRAEVGPIHCFPCRSLAHADAYSSLAYASRVVPRAIAACCVCLHPALVKSVRGVNSMTAVDMEVTRSAVLDDAHVGDIRGALGTIRLDDTAARTTLSAKLKTLLAIVGPGLIVMVGDNDAGAFSTYGQAGPGLRHPPAVDAAAADPGAVREPGDGAPPRRRHRGRPRPADPRPVRQVLGRVLGHRPVRTQRADDHDRVHRHHPRGRLPRACRR